MIEEVLAEARRGYWFSLQGAAELFGIDRVRMGRVITWAGIKVLSLPQDNGRRRHFVSRDTIEAFIENRDYWMLWEPFLITEHTLRVYATELRENEGWRWLSSKEVALALGYGHGFLNSAHSIRRAGLPVCKVGGNYWFKSTDIEAIDIRAIIAQRRKAMKEERIARREASARRAFERRFGNREEPL